MENLFNQSGVLPPFLPNAPYGKSGALSPYPVPLIEFVKRFAKTEPRIVLLKGFLEYRRALKTAGIKSGFQWIDGSFIENTEKIRKRPPKDIDIVTFASRPKDCQDADDWKKFVGSQQPLFHPVLSKDIYSCDAYYEDLDLPPLIIAKRAAYWCGMFSHQRESFLWKGIIEISLNDDESAALSILENGGENAS
jgi:hypothetical protein